MIPEAKHLVSPKRTRTLFPVFKMEGVRLYCEDNLNLMRQLPSRSLKAVYIDPPFFTRRQQVIDSRRKKANTPSYSDHWNGMTEYLAWMKERVTEIARLLRNDGVLFLHCDWHASHYLKVMLDEVFGYENFKNELVWQRSVTIGRISAESFKRLDNITDSVFIYSKSPDTQLKKVFREHLVPFNGTKPPSGYHVDSKSGQYFKTSPIGNYSSVSIEAFRKENRIYITKNDKQRLKYFVDAVKIKGQMYIREERELGNLWTDIPSMMHSSARDKIVYPTQKPIQLITRILQTIVNKGDSVADFFHGSGSTMMAARDLHCNYVGCDSNPQAIKLSLARLEDEQVQLKIAA